MSEFHVNVVRVGPVVKHPNADALSMTTVHGGYPVIMRTGDFSEGDLAVYVPVDSVVPEEERWSFLGAHRRIRAKRLRGVFSMGLLTALPGTTVTTSTGHLWSEGDDAREAMGIVKYEPDQHLYTTGENEKDPGTMPVYDIEGLRKHGGLFVEGEQVWISEKIHGANARFVHDGERLWVGSRTCIKKEDASNLWWAVAAKYDLAAKLATIPNIAIYGEVYGQVQDLRYGIEKGAELVCFDALDVRARRWFDVEELMALLGKVGLPIVPTLYRGPWVPALTSMAEGISTMPGACHVREGIVVKPLVERFDPSVGRVFLKMPGEGYLTRKGG